MSITSTFRTLAADGTSWYVYVVKGAQFYKGRVMLTRQDSRSRVAHSIEVTEAELVELVASAI